MRVVSRKGYGWLRPSLAASFLLAASTTSRSNMKTYSIKRLSNVITYIFVWSVAMFFIAMSYNSATGVWLLLWIVGFLGMFTWHANNSLKELVFPQRFRAALSNSLLAISILFSIDLFLGLKFFNDDVPMPVAITILLLISASVLWLFGYLCYHHYGQIKAKRKASRN